MHQLCDEILQLVLYELDDPTPFILVSRRVHFLSRDPYVRASYFIERYGTQQALFWALGRGKLLNDQVIDMLLSAGAHLSRYLVQIAIGHYFRGHAPFIKSAWVRSVPFPAFAHFLKRASDLFGEIPADKGADDGAVVGRFVSEGRLSSGGQQVKWEDVQEIMEKYKFVPFCPKDPLMAQFPIAWSIEPRILTLAVGNGFVVDDKYRDLVFRKIFEKRTGTARAATHTEEILKHVKELPGLHPRMFISRTVAAEVCMEIKTNPAAYNALRKLHDTGDLLFDLPALITTLMKSFTTTRSIMSKATGSALRALQREHPTSDPGARLAVLITLFNGTKSRPPPAIREKVASLRLKPLTRTDLLELLCNPFVQDPLPALLFARQALKLSDGERRELVAEAAFRCLASPYKGKTLKYLVDNYAGMEQRILRHVSEECGIEAESIPERYAYEGGRAFRAPFCRHASSLNDVAGDGDGEEEHPDRKEDHLGPIGQDPLSAMIKIDETGLARPRYRRYVYYSALAPSRLYSYPEEAMLVSVWVRDTYGAKSAVTATFLTHAIVNGNELVVDSYIRNHVNPAMCVPITLKHFQLLARLGNAPTWSTWVALEGGAQFYRTEAEYVKELRNDGLFGMSFQVKAEPPPSPTGARLPSSPLSSPPSSAPNSPAFPSGAQTHRTPPSATNPTGSLSASRPRRSTARRVTSYAVPDVDDLDADDEMPQYEEDEGEPVNEPEETQLDKWIRHLLVLQQEEQRKYNARRQQVKQVNPKEKVSKNDFYRSLFVNLRDLQRRNDLRRLTVAGSQSARPRPKRRVAVSDDERDDDYRGTPVPKRRRVSS